MTTHSDALCVKVCETHTMWNDLRDTLHRWRYAFVRSYRQLCDRLKYIGYDDESDGCVRYAKSELVRIGWHEHLKDCVDTDDRMLHQMGHDILQVLRLFSEQERSGCSIGEFKHLFDRLSSFHPLTPLYGTDDEWRQIADDEYQNKRRGSVFKNTTTGHVYDLDGRVFIGKDGCSFTRYGHPSGINSAVDITFPYIGPEMMEYGTYPDDETADVSSTVKSEDNTTHG